MLISCDEIGKSNWLKGNERKNDNAAAQPYLFDLDCSAVTLMQFVSLTFRTGNTQIQEDMWLDKHTTTDSFVERI